MADPSPAAAILFEYKRLLENDMKTKSTEISIAIVLCLLVGVVLFYATYKICAISYDWWNTNVRGEAAANIVLSTGNNIFLDPSFDDEVPSSSTQEEMLDDEYTRVTQTIRNSFNAYQTYNKSLQDFYANALKKTAPDKVDPTSLLAENDNW